MYEGFYGLKADPFRLSADHRFCYSHRSYARAKAYIQYALYRAEGFVMVTGRPGTGKTTLVNDLLSTLPNKEVVAGTLVSTQLEAEDLLLMAAHAFGLDVEAPQKAVVLQHLIEFFNDQHRKGLRTLLIIDEAQDLASSALEELRLLTNLQHNGEPLLQIALLGQDSLREIVRVPAMEQVHQRLIAAWRLEALTPEETIGYVRHRLECAGWTGDPSLEPGVLPIVHAFSQGVPRRINLICSRLLLHGYIGRRHTLTAEDAETVTGELQHEELALPDYGDALGDEGASGKSRGGESTAQDGRSSVWGEIDRGLFGPAAVPDAKDSDRAPKASAPSPGPRAQQVAAQPRAATPPSRPPKASQPPRPPETPKV
ncbi:AAA family ATPase, partial [Thioalkalivibrio sp.]|uniref:ExeA family protein n=1 Tax=Thioalkalivibrio sp. TaxID=2093813 RepID=UPI0012D52F5E